VLIEKRIPVGLRDELVMGHYPMHREVARWDSLWGLLVSWHWENSPSQTGRWRFGKRMQGLAAVSEEMAVIASCRFEEQDEHI
jgi:hypothetical protein